MKDDLDCNIAFIEEVKKHPELYNNINTINYNNHNVTGKIWNEIAEKFDDTAESCKCRWKALRSSYCRSINHKGVKEYYLAKYMEFLRPFTKSRTKTPSDPVKEKLTEPPSDNSDFLRHSSDDNEYDDDETDSPESKRMKTMNKAETFLISLVPSLEKMNNEQFNQFQMMTLNVIDQILN